MVGEENSVFLVNKFHVLSPLLWSLFSKIKSNFLYHLIQSHKIRFYDKSFQWCSMEKKVSIVPKSMSFAVFSTNAFFNHICFRPVIFRVTTELGMKEEAIKTVKYQSARKTVYFTFNNTDGHKLSAKSQFVIEKFSLLIP